MKNNNPARIIYLTIIVTMLLSMVGAVWGFLRVFRGQIFDNEITEMREVAEASLDQLVILFDDLSADITSLTLDNDIRAFASDNFESDREISVNDKIQTLKGNHEGLTIYIMDTKGIVKVSTDERFMNNNYSFRSYFTKAFNNKIIYEAAVGKTSKELGIYLSKAIRDPGGNVLGVVVLKLNPSFFQFAQNEKYSYYVTDEYGVVLFSTNQAEVLTTLVDFTQYEPQVQEELKIKYPLPLDTSSSKIEVFESIYQTQKQEGVLQLDDNSSKHKTIHYFLSKQDLPLYVLLTSNREILMSPYENMEYLMVFVIVASFIVPTLIIMWKMYALFHRFTEAEEEAHQIIESVEKVQELHIPFLPRITKAIKDLYTLIQKQQVEAAIEVKKLTKKVDETEENLTKQQAAILNVLEDAEDSRKKAVDFAKDLEKFKLAVDGVADVVVITDSHGVILYTNPISKEVTGYTLEEARGKTPGSLWGSQMDASFYRNMWKTISHDKKPFQAEVNNHRKDGSEYIAYLHIAPLLNEKGDVEFYVGVQRDITRERQIDRMKTEFISLASHQLRTPLSAIKWYLEMMRDGDAGKLNDHQAKYINEVYLSNQRMISLVNSLLNISRIESGRIIVEPAKTDINKLINDVLKEVKVLADTKKIKITVRISSQVPLIMLDARMIRNVYMNLLSNAIKYSPEKTTISIDVRVKGSSLYSSVSDEGYGIPDNQKDRIFTKFFRATNVTSNDTDGSGLGLYLVKAIIDSSGGEIGFESKEKTSKNKHSGTTFWFTLPLKGMKKKQGEVRVDD